MSFGYALKKFREDRGLSLRELGKLCEISYAYISRLEKAEKTAPSDQTVDALIRALKIDARRTKLLRTLVGITAPECLIDVFVEDDQRDLNLFGPLSTMSFRGRRPLTKEDWRRKADRLEAFLAEDTNHV